MRFKIGAIPLCEDFTPADPWRALREPSVIVMQVIAFPLGILAGGVVGLLWLSVVDAKVLMPESPAQFLITFALIIPVHELIHAAVHPGMGRSRESILGFWPATVVFYAHYEGELSRNRLIAILVAPFLVISVAPLVVCMTVGGAPQWAPFASTLNAFLAYGDLFGVCLLLWQTPPSAQVRNQGWRTYWKPAEAETPAPPG